MKEAAYILRDKGCTGIPVVEGDTVVGMVSRSDFKKVGKSSPLHAPVKAYMSVNVVSTNPATPVNKAVRLMIKNNIGRLPVVENEKLIGIVTRSDAMRYYYDLLPD